MMTATQLTICEQLREEFFEDLDNAFATLLSSVAEAQQHPCAPAGLHEAVLNWLDLVKQEISDLSAQNAAQVCP